MVAALMCNFRYTNPQLHNHRSASALLCEAASYFRRLCQNTCFHACCALSMVRTATASTVSPWCACLCRSCRRISWASQAIESGLLQVNLGGVLVAVSNCRCHNTHANQLVLSQWRKLCIKCPLLSTHKRSPAHHQWQWAHSAAPLWQACVCEFYNVQSCNGPQHPGIAGSWPASS